MKPAPFAYVAPTDLGEVLDLLARSGGEARPLAGGQSLLPMVNMRVARPEVLVDLGRVAALRGMRDEGDVVCLGATARQLEAERRLGERLPLLARALRFVGHVATRARGTIGGSLAHADPAGELPAVLLALDGSVVASSAARGERVVAAAELQTAALTTSLAEDELLTEVRLPARAGARHGFVEVARRHGDFALVGAAAEVELDAAGAFARVALALFGVADRPQRVPELERALVGQRPGDVAGEVRAAVAAAVSPFDDAHATAAYRRRVAGVVAARALEEAAASGAGGAAESAEVAT